MSYNNLRTSLRNWGQKVLMVAFAHLGLSLWGIWHCNMKGLNSYVILLSPNHSIIFQSNSLTQDTHLHCHVSSGTMLDKKTLEIGSKNDFKSSNVKKYCQLSGEGLLSLVCVWRARIYWIHGVYTCLLSYCVCKKFGSF